MIKFAKFTSVLILIFAVLMVTLSSFLVGYIKGYSFGNFDAESKYKALINEKVSSTALKTPTPGGQTPTPSVSWGGPDLWEAVNKRRVENGVNPLTSEGEVCTIASIRLNQILDLDKLDGHVGFSTLPDTRPDLKYIFEKYDLTEFLVSGATSAQNAVDLWENTLGHKELVTGGQYVWGCIYAQNGFGVAITAY